MRPIGTFRKIDNLGRIVIPKEYRTHLSMNSSDLVEVLLTSSGILIKKPKVLCYLCGRDNALTEFEDGYICQECIDKIKRL